MFKLKTSDNKIIQINKDQFLQFKSLSDIYNDWNEGELEININFSESQIQRFIELIKTKNYKNMLCGQIKEEIKKCLQKQDYEQINKLNYLISLVNNDKQIDYNGKILKLIVNDLLLITFICNDEYIKLVKTFFKKKFDAEAFPFHKKHNKYNGYKFLFEYDELFLNDDIKYELIGIFKELKPNYYSRVIDKNNEKRKEYYVKYYDNQITKIQEDIEDVKKVSEKITPRIIFIECENSLHIFDRKGRFIKKDFFTDFKKIKYFRTYDHGINITHNNGTIHQYTINEYKPNSWTSYDYNHVYTKYKEKSFEKYYIKFEKYSI